ncbi:oxidoreductase [Spirosoma sp. SC4-14]|uniref:oxidoreductase n=1 Tax=Spirosoma sp. SC4-14 TaxID=3128900 RepID=UPI0030CE9099
MVDSKTKIWFITGISGGLGNALANAAMQEGHFVIGTFRHDQQVADFNGVNTGKGFAVKLDITNRSQIEDVVRRVVDQFGRVDVLVNNAGFGFAGAIEEASENEIRAVFEANFFGTLALTRAFLPLFRKQRHGYIMQISSQSGFKAVAGFGVYNASKFALEGASEALAAEIAPLGIKLTIIEPGPFRTNFAGSSFARAASQLDDYDATAGAFRSRMEQIDGRQEGDPVKAAGAILQLITLESPPLRLPLGKIAVSTIQSKLDSVQTDLNNWRTVAEGAVY